MATIREVAKIAGVSIASVSRVLNHPETVSPEKRTTIERVMNDLGFSPNGSARSLALNKTSTIALIVPNILNPIYPEIAKGVEDIIYRRGYNLLFCNTDLDPQKEKNYLDTFLGRRVDGLILVGGFVFSEDIYKIQNQKIPLVLIGRKIPEIQENSVYVDFELGGYLATKHLLDLGHPNVAFIAGPEREAMDRDKQMGYRRALKEKNIPPRDDYVVQGNGEIEGGYLCAKTLMRNRNPPRAIFAANDLMAIGALDAIKDLSLRIPEQVAIVGFDNIKMSALVDPKLTTVSYPAYRMGALAARLLFDTIDSKNIDGKPREIHLQVELKIRKSCGHTGRVQEIFS